ncbi:uncharacterized protein RJT21DRAFT_113651 [Scheffersomyces amazonensis]|uniref:uncharacterized protein n=1 Tax=Scheffersomyces amazonensis TaxID=1078765 RepID=UPI00315CE05A
MVQLFSSSQKTTKIFAALSAVIMVSLFLSFCSTEFMPNGLDYADNEPVILRKRWPAWLIGAGTFLFAAVAKGAEIGVNLFCSPELLEAVVMTGNFEGVIPCVACASLYVLGGAISAAFATEGAANGWEWFQGNGVTGKRDLEDYKGYYMNSFTNSLHYSSTDLEVEFNANYSSLLEAIPHQLLFVGVSTPNGTELFDGLSNSIKKRDLNEFDHSKFPLIHVTFAVDNRTTTILSTYGNIEQGLTDLTWNTPPDSLEKRSSNEVTYVSFNSYGLNMDLARNFEASDHTVAHTVAESLSDSSWVNYYDGIASKYCMALGTNDKAGVDSIIVGEVYVQAYGGIDNECDSF